MLSAGLFNSGVPAPQVEDSRQYGDGNEAATHSRRSGTESKALMYYLLQSVLSHRANTLYF